MSIRTERFRKRARKAMRKHGGRSMDDGLTVLRCQFDSQSKASSAYHELLVGKPRSVELAAFDGRLTIYF